MPASTALRRAAATSAGSRQVGAVKDTRRTSKLLGELGELTSFQQTNAPVDAAAIEIILAELDGLNTESSLADEQPAVAADYHPISFKTCNTHRRA